MNLVTLENYRCFREKQEARLAPLTFLVGENSTGKTSFLAMVRALRKVAFESTVPDFREPPFDLGTFAEIAHNRIRGGAKSFEAGFSGQTLPAPIRVRLPENQPFTYAATFESLNGIPYPTYRRISAGDRLLEVSRSTMRMAVSDREALIRAPERLPLHDVDQLPPFFSLVSRWLRAEQDSEEQSVRTSERVSNTLTELDGNLILGLAAISPPASFVGLGLYHTFAGAPVRSTPRRTYDPTRPFQDPEGEYIPTLLVNMSRRDQEEWSRLKRALEGFGEASGLFNEISIVSLGKAEGSPFQLQVRKHGVRLRGRRRNLMDVGYGVSQVLPVLIELLREDHATMFLLQQPEVHLHPMAQAALGSLFCQVANWTRQILVETHSDYIIDRVRMDVRDKKTNLKPEDVSILYFEPDGLDVKIHSLELDADGNILNAPSGYRQFFMEEMRRSIGL